MNRNSYTQIWRRFYRYIVPGLRAMAAQRGFPIWTTQMSLEKQMIYFGVSNGWHEIIIQIPEEMIDDCQYGKIQELVKDATDMERRSA